MFLKGSAPLELPTGYIDPQWIENQYSSQLTESQQIRASLGTSDVNSTLSELKASPGGLEFMGKELRSPLLRESLYESTDSNLLQVYKLSQSEQAFFSSDIEAPAAAIGVSGLPGLCEITTDLIRIDTQVFASNIYIRWNVSNWALYDILQAAQQRMKASLMFQQSAAWVRLLQYASGLRSGQGVALSLIQPGATTATATAASNNAPLSIATSTPGRLDVPQVSQAVANFGSRLIRGQKKLYFNPQRQADLVNFNNGGAGTGGNGYFAPNTQEMLLSKGNTGNWLGCEVYEDIMVPPVTTLAIDSKGVVGGNENVMAYIVGPSEFLGVKVIRTDLTIETQKLVTQFSDVFGGWGELGYYMRFVKAVQRLTTA